jgi:hypothetical protein
LPPVPDFVAEQAEEDIKMQVESKQEVSVTEERMVGKGISNAL